MSDACLKAVFQFWIMVKLFQNKRFNGLPRGLGGRTELGSL
ncbi:hypothetical protein HMPREF9370_1311 [Neisseria wadsworthii 9715]|uniref:Uncharacterized protein n=1 Tax=Neisseria wadsworthii 9715 TaxID=1030841 RepID=G4CQF1_9NEIS|nr:hypothetical protein HMPREF9370_1311 [Neisseria wadsworthii 9715]